MKYLVRNIKFKSVRSLCILSLTLFSQLTYGVNIDSLLKIVSHQEDAIKVNTLNQIAVHYYQQYELNKSTRYLESALEISERLNYKKGIAFLLSTRGQIASQRRNYQEALNDLNQSVEIFREIGGKKGLSKTLINKASIHYNMGDYDHAMQSSIESLKLMEDIGDEKGIYRNYHNIATILTQQKEYDRALEYYEKILAADNLGITRTLGYTYNNMANIYLEQDKTDLALEFHLKSLGIFEQIEFLPGMSLANFNLGEDYGTISDFGNALKYYKKGLKIATEKEFSFELIVGHGMLGMTYVDMDSIDKGQEHLLKSLELANKFGANYDVMNAYFELYNVAKDKDNSKALEYFELYNIYKDSIFNIEKRKVISELEQKYEAEKKESEIAVLKKEKSWWIVFGVISIVAGISGVFIVLLRFHIMRVRKKLVQKNLELANYSKVSSSIPVQEITKAKESSERYESSSLTVDQENELMDSILRLMKDEKLYLDKNLTINVLKDRLGTSRTYVSQVINNKLNTNFSNFVNKYRILESQILLSDPQYSNYTIEHIAEKVGFGNHTSFYTAFKKFTGVTPSFYLKTVLKQSEASF